MAKKKLHIKEIFAANLKENRKKRGFTQEKLAEIADISLRYIAMLEVGKAFPSGEMLEKLAMALDIDTIQLFGVAENPEWSLYKFEQSIISNIKEAVKEAVKESLNEECKRKK